MNIIQARLLVVSLKVEIDSMTRGSKLQLTREPAMRTLGRLCGFDAYAEFGKGLKGRQAALEWLNEVLALPENQYA